MTTSFNQQAKEFSYIMERAQELATKYDIPIDVALNRLGGQVQGKQEPLIDTQPLDKESL